MRIGHQFDSLDDVVIHFNEKMRKGNKEDSVELFINYYKKYLRKLNASRSVMNRIDKFSTKIGLENNMLISVKIISTRWYSVSDEEVLEKLNNTFKQLDWNYLISVETEARSRLAIEKIVQSL